jgi:serine/threonine protein kinase
MPNVDHDDYQLSIDDEGGRGGDVSRNRKKTKISFSIGDLVLSTTVGTGTFGRVRVVQFKPTRDWYALKIMKKSEILRLSQLDHILSEVKILSTTSHPFIVNLLGMQFDEKRLYLLFEYVPGGELFSYLRREGKFSESSSQFYAAEILLAFEHLHKSKIVYRDLKPENLLLTKKGHIKITDFGFAKVVPDRTYSLCGTPEYLAPEIIQTAGHGKGVDWWALGILIYEMLAGYPPFNAETQQGIYAKICAGEISWPRCAG